VSPYVRLGLLLLIVIMVVAAMFACAPMPLPAPEPITVIKEVDRIVQARCEDKREPAPEFPDDENELAAVNIDDPVAVFILAQKYVAARKLYRARLKADDDQIAACTGG